MQRLLFVALLAGLFSCSSAQTRDKPPQEKLEASIERACEHKLELDGTGTSSVSDRERQIQRCVAKVKSLPDPVIKKYTQCATVAGNKNQLLACDRQAGLSGSPVESGSAAPKPGTAAAVHSQRELSEVCAHLFTVMMAEHAGNKEIPPSVLQEATKQCVKTLGQVPADEFDAVYPCLMESNNQEEMEKCGDLLKNSR